MIPYSFRRILWHFGVQTGLFVSSARNHQIYVILVPQSNYGKVPYPRAQQAPGWSPTLLEGSCDILACRQDYLSVLLRTTSFMWLSYHRVIMVKCLTQEHNRPRMIPYSFRRILWHFGMQAGLFVCFARNHQIYVTFEPQSNYGKVPYPRAQHVGNSGARTRKLWITSRCLYPLSHTCPQAPQLMYVQVGVIIIIII